MSGVIEKASKPGPGIVQCDKLLHTDPLTLNLPYSNIVCDSYDNTRLLQKYSKGVIIAELCAGKEIYLRILT